MAVLAAICAISFTACVFGGNKDSQKQEEDIPREYKNGTYTLLDFEKKSDLFALRPYNSDILDAYGKVAVVFGEKFADGAGNGSLKYSYVGGKNPALILYPERSACSDLPLDKLMSFGIQVYNASDAEKTVKYSIVSTTEEVYSQTQKLKSGWNKYELTLDSVFVRYRQADIYAFCIEFESGKSCDYYLDNWTATIGESDYTEVQKKANAFVNAVEKTGDNVTAASSVNLIEAFKNYTELNEICKAAVKNYYDKFAEQVKKYFEIIGWASGSETEKELLHFGNDFGVLQLFDNENTQFTYQSNKTVGEQKGAVKFSLEDTATDYVFDFITPTIVLANYDYLSCYIENATDGKTSFWFNDYDKTVISANETINLMVPIKAISESDNKFTINASSVGDVYITEVKAVALPRDHMYEKALNDRAFTVKSGSVAFENAEAKHTVKIQSANSEFKPDKRINVINVAQSVSFAVASSKACSLVLKNADGAEVKTVSVSEKARTVTLTKTEYEAMNSIAVGAANADIEFSDFLLSRTADEDYISVFLMSDHVVKGANVTIDTFKEAIYYLRTFENMVLYKQNYMKNNDSAVYTEIAARAAKVSAVMNEMIAHLSGGTATDAECEILLGLSDTYLSLKTVQTLSAEKQKTLSAAKKGVLMNYKYNIFDFENPSAPSLFKRELEFYSCDWDVKTENFLGQNVLAVDGIKPSKEDYYYIRYDFSSVENVINEYDYVVWRVYNASVWQKELFFIKRGWNYGMVYGKFILPAGQWTEFTMSASDFANAGYMVLYESKPGDKYYFDNVSAYSAQYVKARIDALPEADKVTVNDRNAISEAKKAYDRLSTAGKTKVDSAKLAACIEKISTLPYAFFDMNDSSVAERFTHPTDIPAYTWNGDLYLTTHAEKGGVLALHATGSTGKEQCVYFGFNLNEIDLSWYKTVKFSVYNPKNEDLMIAVITYGWGEAVLTTTLAKESWTEITISVADLLKAARFDSTGYIYVRSISRNEEVTLFFTDFIAYN